VDPSADTTGVTLSVADDGVGIPQSGRRSGLSNLRERAEQLGGTFAAKPPWRCEPDGAAWRVGSGIGESDRGTEGRRRTSVEAGADAAAAGPFGPEHARSCGESY
jgi:hypothetical protein